MKKYLLILLTLVIGGLSTYLYFKPTINTNEKIHIGFVGPLSGENASGGKSVIQAVQLYIANVNKSGGINGRKIQLDLFDDQNKSELATQRSLEISTKSQVLAVVGHNWSSTSMAGGGNYKKYGIPAISPTATSVGVTKDNPWYFRTVSNDNIQGKFLAHYIRNVLNLKNITIIQHESVYGKYLSKVMSNTARKIGLNVSQHYVVDTESDTAENDFANIAAKIKKDRNSGALFIAMYETKGAALIRILKDAGVTNKIVTPDAFASSAFTNLFKSFPKEILSPGYYTDGIYVSCPMIFDTASEKAQSFYHEYQKKYAEIPDWSAASAYDATMMVIEAIKQTGATGAKSTLKQERENIRNFLSKTNTQASGVEGVTGNNYFNEQGDAIKPLNIGVYQKGGNVSSLVQLQNIRHPKQIENMPESDLIAFDQFLLTKTNVVYTGISVNKIDEMDLGDLTFDMDFNIWFRSRPNVKVEDIIFNNAVEPISLGKPVKSEVKSGLQYKRFRVKGKFRADFLPSFDVKKHTLSVSFRHKTLTRDNLIFVVDVLGMGMENPQNILEKLKQDQTLNPVYNWDISDLIAYQDVEKTDSLGDMSALYNKDGFINFSRYNYKMFVKEKEFNLFEFVSLRFMLIILGASFGITFLLYMLRAMIKNKQFSRSLWCSKTVSAFLLMVCAENIIIDWMVGKLDDYYIRHAIIAFEILWWVIPVWVLVLSVETFLWAPLEKKTEKNVPSLIKRITASIIMLFAFFGILAFVFDQKITSLLATSGAVAMIIGFAIQVNIANIFSGIILNIDNKIRIGDWIMVHGRTPTPDVSLVGCVVDIGWRTTQLKTTDNNLALIPNSVFANKAFTNFMLPEEVSNFDIAFCLPFSVPADVGIKLINDGARAVVGHPEGPSSEPKMPKTAVSGIKDKGLVYKVNYWILPREVSIAKSRNTIIKSVMEHLKNEGVSIAYPTNITHFKSNQIKKYSKD